MNIKLSPVMLLIIGITLSYFSGASGGSGLSVGLSVGGLVCIVAGVIGVSKKLFSGGSKRKDETELFEYIDEIAKKLACTYVSLLVPKKIIQDEDLVLLSDDKTKCSVVVYAICCQQLSRMPDTVGVVVPILIQRTVYHLTREIVNTDYDKYEPKILEEFRNHFKTYHKLSEDVPKLFGTLAGELNLKTPSDNLLMDSLLVADTITNYVSKMQINDFSKNIRRLV